MNKELILEEVALSSMRFNSYTKEDRMRFRALAHAAMKAGREEAEAIKKNFPPEPGKDTPTP